MRDQQPLSLVDQIAFRLQADILDGAYTPGSHLQQDEICSRFGVSRTPVREALRKLQAQNLVVLTPNKGATVRVPTRRDLEEVYAVRAELEGFAAELAAARWGPVQAAELQAAQAMLGGLVEGALRVGEASPEAQAAISARVGEANNDFHAIIRSAAGNERARQMVVELQSLFPKDQVWRAIPDAEEARVLNVSDHERIAAALANGDGGAARTAMRDHILHAGRLLISYLGEQGFWALDEDGAGSP